MDLESIKRKITERDLSTGDLGRGAPISMDDFYAMNVSGWTPFLCVGRLCMAVLGGDFKPTGASWFGFSKVSDGSMWFAAVEVQANV